MLIFLKKCSIGLFTSPVSMMRAYVQLGNDLLHTTTVTAQILRDLTEGSIKEYLIEERSRENK